VGGGRGGLIAGGIFFVLLFCDSWGAVRLGFGAGLFFVFFGCVAGGWGAAGGGVFRGGFGGGGWWGGGGGGGCCFCRWFSLPGGGLGCCVGVRGPPLPALFYPYYFSWALVVVVLCFLAVVFLDGGRGGLCFSCFVLVSFCGGVCGFLVSGGGGGLLLFRGRCCFLCWSGGALVFWVVFWVCFGGFFCFVCCLFFVCLCGLGGVLGVRWFLGVFLGVGGFLCVVFFFFFFFFFFLVVFVLGWWGFFVFFCVGGGVFLFFLFFVVGGGFSVGLW